MIFLAGLSGPGTGCAGNNKENLAGLLVKFITTKTPRERGV